MKTLLIAALLGLASTAHAALRCEHVFKTDFEKNSDIKNGSDGRVTPAFAARMKVAYTIGGKTYALETIVR